MEELWKGKKLEEDEFKVRLKKRKRKADNVLQEKRKKRKD